MHSMPMFVLVTVDGVWLSWQFWSSCDKSCGNGTRTRIRECYYQSDAPQGELCPGTTDEKDGCIIEACPGKLGNS